MTALQREAVLIVLQGVASYVVAYLTITAGLLIFGFTLGMHLNELPEATWGFVSSMFWYGRSLETDVMIFASVPLGIIGRLVIYRARQRSRRARSAI